MTSRNKRFRVINYLDIAPLIDCMLLLLIFFLLTSSFINQDQNQGFNVNLPKAAFAQGLEESSLIVYLNSKGEVFLNGQNIKPEDLKTKFLSSKKPVIIKADKDVRLEIATGIMDLARSCKIEKLSIATINEK